MNDVANSAPILNIPNEILDHIFSFLPIKERIRTELVCRSWAEFGKNCKWSWPKKLSSRQVHELFKTRGNAAWSFLLPRCGTSLKELEVVERNDFFSRETFRTLHKIGENCPNLTSILLEIGCALTDPEAVPSIMRGCKRLKTIDISLHLNRVGKRFATKLLLALKECQYLEYFEIHCHSAIIEEGCLDAIIGPLKGFKMGYSALKKFSVFTEKLLQRRDPLEELGLVFPRNDPQVSPVKVVRNYEDTLRELDLSDCSMSSNIWCQIPVTLKHLQVLTVISSSTIEDEFMRVVSVCCKKLRKLNINQTKVTDEGVSHLTALPKLAVLNLSRIKSINGEGLLSLAVCGRLEMVSLAYIEHRADLIEESCIALATNCPNLKLLVVNENVNVTHRLVDEFRCAIQRGSIKGPVALRLSSKQVKPDVEVCENLNLFFDFDNGWMDYS